MDSDELLRQLLTQDPASVEVWTRQPDLPPGLNWLGLAEAAGWRALHSADASPDTRLAWARVSIIARERVAEAAGTARERDRQVLAVMRLRTELINRLGAMPGHPLLNCDEIVRWFLARHDDTEYDAAIADTDHWRSLPIERIRDLRDIKNDLGVLRGMSDCPSLGSPEIQRWFALRDQLP